MESLFIHPSDDVYISISLMTGFVVQGHVYIILFNFKSLVLYFNLLLFFFKCHLKYFQDNISCELLA